MTHPPSASAEGTFGVYAIDDCNAAETVAMCSPLRKQPKPAPAPESSDIAKLAEVVKGLTHQVQHLALILDEVREDVVWAVRNDKFHCGGHSQKYVASYTAPPAEAETEDDEEVATNPPPPESQTLTAKPKTTLFE